MHLQINIIICFLGYFNIKKVMSDECGEIKEELWCCVLQYSYLLSLGMHFLMETLFLKFGYVKYVNTAVQSIFLCV
jgi:hypothetical protein